MGRKLPPLWRFIEPDYFYNLRTGRSVALTPITAKRYEVRHRATFGQTLRRLSVHNSKKSARDSLEKYIMIHSKG